MKRWRVNPHEPFNTRVWQDIAVELFRAQLLHGAAHLTLCCDGRTLRLITSEDSQDSPESDAQSSVE